MTGFGKWSIAAPFRGRNFRFLWCADLATSWAFEMESLVLGWYIFVSTGSVLLLTIFGSLLFVGTLLSPMLGVAADRFGHRNTLCIMRLIYALLSITLTVAIFAELLTPELALVTAFFSGLVRPSDIGMRNALVAEIVPRQLLVSAMSVARTTSDSARVVGALVGSSLFALVGIGPTYVVIASFYVTGLILTLSIATTTRDGDPDGPRPAQPSVWRALWEGITYIWQRPHLQSAMWLAFLVNLTAFPLTIGLLPYVAKEIHGSDETGLGYLLASFAGGALIGSLLLSTFGRSIRPARMMLIFSVIWHGMLLAFTYTADRHLAMVLLMLAGLSQSLCLVPLAILLVRASSEAFRGRVMGVRMLAIYGLPVGLVVSGWLIERLGYHTAVTLYLVAGIAFTGVIGLRWYKALWPEGAVGNAR